MSVHPCNVCGEDAIGCYSPDIDIKGLCFCEEHKEQVSRVYTVIMTGGCQELCDTLMKDWKYK